MLFGQRFENPDFVSVSASPGFTWGRSGNVVSGAWLLNDGVPSNTTGRNFPLYNGELLQISVSNDNVNTFTIGFYQHNKTTYTQLATASIVAGQRGVFDYSGILITQNLELAIKVESGNCKNPVVQIIAKGTITP
jgi:hypothetical protein